MEYSSEQSLIQEMVSKIREELFASFDAYSFVSPSAYDTAWVAMVPALDQPDHPAFVECLNWVLDNQREEGFWGEVDGQGQPTIDSLPATLACMVALRTWKVGGEKIDAGLAFLRSGANELLRRTENYCPRWFALVFPAMVERAEAIGLKVLFPNSVKETITNIFQLRQEILQRESLADGLYFPPLLSYLEALPASYHVDIDKYLSEDGSLFQSPSATAWAFIVNGNKRCLDYLQSLIQRCANGVPPMFPIDEELVKLSMVNHIQRLGISEHFPEEIEEILAWAYSNYMNQESEHASLKPAQLYKDSLAFRLLRMHGYSISPWRFCWFLQHQDIKQHIENNWECFSSVLFNIYRSADLMFSGEYDLEEAKYFSKNLLEKILYLNTTERDLVISTDISKMVEHELSLTWMARLDHLDHRLWIEEHEMHTLWMGKASFFRLLCLENAEVLQLAVKNYEFRQLIYKSELEKLARWSSYCGLSNLNFGRKKTSYLYFAIAACCSLPAFSPVRVITAKSAIIITVADDFFDMEGSMSELISLTKAVRRWDGKGLSGPSKTIFDALDDFVSDLAALHLHEQGTDITKYLQHIWSETFDSWLMEALWSRSQQKPSMDMYLETGMKSIAAHTLVLQASCFLNPSLPGSKLKPTQYETATILLMLMCRLLNDIQSYEKEQDGKINLTLLYLEENPEAGIEDSIARVREIVDEKKKEFLEHVLMEGSSDLPNSSKRLHLSCLKVFQMFFNTSNGFDSNSKMVPDIQKAIFIPPVVRTFREPKPQRLPSELTKSSASACYICTSKHQGRSLVRTAPPNLAHLKKSLGNTSVLPNFKFCF